MNARLLLTALLLTLSASSQAALPAFTGTDYSGTYDCTGLDAHEGNYSGTVTLALVRAQSTESYGAYDFTLDVPGFGTYRGHAAADGRAMAIHFALPDPSSADYGTGIANFSRNRDGKWSFRKFYYEPEYKGGNNGFEQCVRR